MNYASLLALAAPETALVISALAVLGVDLFALRELDPKFRRIICAMLCCVGCHSRTQRNKERGAVHERRRRRPSER